MSYIWLLYTKEAIDMVNPIIKVGKNVLLKGGKFAVECLAPNVLDLGAKIGNDFIEKQKSLVKIPDFEDVLIDESLHILKDELNLIPVSVIAQPRLAYADKAVGNVVYSKPRFGSRVDPKTTVKLYYLTQEVIDRSKELSTNKVQEFSIKNIVGCNIYEAREDLESLGLRVSEKLETPNLKFISLEDGQVTKATYSNNQKIGSKVKTGDRICLYYVNEEIILESKSIKDKKDKENKEKIDKVEQAAKDAYLGAIDNAQNIAKKIGDPFTKKKNSSEDIVELPTEENINNEV